MMNKIKFFNRLNLQDIYDLFVLSIIRILPIILNILIIKFFISYEKNQVNDYIIIVTVASIICTFSNYGILNYLMKFKKRYKSRILSLFLNLKIPIVIFLFFICCFATLINLLYLKNFNEVGKLYIASFFLVIFLFGLNNLNSFYFNAINMPKTASLFRFTLIGLFFYIFLLASELNFIISFFYSCLISVIISYIIIFKLTSISNFHIIKNLKFYNFISSNRHLGLSSILSSLMLLIPMYIFTFVYKENEIFIFFFVTKICNLFFIFNAIFENKFIYQYSKYFVEKNFKKIRNYLIYRTKLVLVPILALLVGLTLFKSNIFNYFEIGYEYTGIYIFTVIIGSVQLTIGPVIQYMLFYNLKTYYKKTQYIMYLIYYIFCLIIIFSADIYTSIYFILILYTVHNLMLVFILFKKMNRSVYKNQLYSG